jgi:hypothetical protein
MTSPSETIDVAFSRRFPPAPTMVTEMEKWRSPEAAPSLCPRRPVPTAPGRQVHHTGRVYAVITVGVLADLRTPHQALAASGF